MRDLLRLLPMRNLWRKRLRSVLTVIGAAAGVALFVSIEIINASTLRYFAEGVHAMAGGAALTVSASAAGFSERERNKLLTLAGLRNAVPSVEAVGYVRRAGAARPEVLGVLGVDPELEPLVRTHRLEHAPPGLAALQALDRADAVLLPKGFAAGGKTAAGGSIELLTVSGIVRLDVAGALAPAGGGMSGFAVVGLATAQRLFGFDGRLTRLDIVAEKGQDIDALAVAIRGRLGPGFTVASSRAREADLQRILQGYQALLGFVGVITVLAGAIVLGATVGASVREQIPSIGILRALGATRASVLLLVLAEAALLGGVAAALGVLGGRLGAELLVGAVTSTMAHQYMIPIRPAALHYPRELALSHALFAWLVAVAAALVPAVRAARLAPVQAIRPAHIEADPRFPSWLAWLGAAGGALAGYLCIVVAARLDRNVPAWQTANAGIGLVSALALTPLAVITSVRLLRGTRAGRGLIDRRVVLRLAVSTVLRAPVRSAWNTLLLSIGLLMFVTAATLHQSLLASVEGWLDRTVSSDLLVSSPGRLFMIEVQPLHEALARDIDAIPGVRVDEGRGAAGIRYVTIRYAGQNVTLKAFDRPHASMARLPFDLRSDYPLRFGGDIFADPHPAVLVSENFVRHFRKQTGDELTLDSPTGPLRAEIIGVVTDYASPQGVIYLPRDLYRRYWQDPLVTIFSVMVKPGMTVAEVAATIDSTLGGTKGLHATNNREVHRQMRDILNESFAYTHAIEAAALIAAILGIMNSTMAAVLARQRELAVLRALGMTRPAVVRMVICETLCQAVPAALAASVLGWLLAYLCLGGVLSALMGWTLEFHASPWTLGETLILGVLAGGMASALAVWRSVNLEITEALVAY
jgi:putative ABC transport system permease protein